MALGSMKQSWGPGLLILGAVVLIEGESPCLGREWYVGVRGLSSAPAV